MVLSNKRLKQRLRSAKAELLAASEAKIHPNNNDATNPGLSSQTQQSLKSLVESATSKPRLSKREKRREKKVSLPEGAEVVNKKSGDGDGNKGGEEGVSVILTEQKKKNKRKRDEMLPTGDSEKVEAKEPKKSTNKKKKKKQKKKKGKKSVESENAGGEIGVQNVEDATDSLISPEISKKVYVGGIPFYSTEDDIRSYFEGCGSITEVDCMTFPESGKFRGIAIICFKTEAAAKRALALDGSDMGGLFLKIQPYKSTKEHKVPDFTPSIVEGYNRAYVGSLSWDITEDELKKFFSDCSINSIRFGEDKETGEFRGYAHVDFADSLSLNLALKLDQKFLLGRPVRITCAVPLKKPAQNKSKPMPKIEKADNNEASAVSGKIRRRTCYECGERGHLSSSCPKKQVSDSVNPSAN